MAEEFKEPEVPQRDYFEALRRESQKAIEIASQEREKAIEVASEEREKAAAALRDQLTERIAAGDANLREHIAAQINTLRLMVENTDGRAQNNQSSIEKQMKERFDAIEKQQSIVHEASQAAIQKAETSNEKRFMEQNDWRRQWTERERTQREETAKFASTLTPRERADAIEEKLTAQAERNRDDIEKLNKRIDLREGQSIGQKISTGMLVTVITVAISIVGIIIVLANYATSAK